MNPKYFGLNETIGKLVKSPADQGRIVGIAAAMAASSHGHLPSSAVNNPLAFYAEQVSPAIAERMSEINESIVFSAREALNYGLIFWKLRYYSAFPATVAADLEFRLRNLLEGKAGRNMDCHLIWSGGLAVISDEMNQFMTKYKTEITLIAAQLMVIMAPPTMVDDQELVNG